MDHFGNLSRTLVALMHVSQGITLVATVGREGQRWKSLALTVVVAMG